MDVDAASAHIAEILGRNGLFCDSKMSSNVIESTRELADCTNAAKNSSNRTALAYPLRLC